MTEERGRYDIGREEISPAALHEYTDPRYVPPTAADVRGALRKANLTGGKAGQLVGVDGRTVRKWTGGETQMPYSAWRLLLIEARLLEVAPADGPTNIDTRPGRSIMFTFRGEEYAIPRETFTETFGGRGEDPEALRSTLQNCFARVREAIDLGGLREMNGRRIIDFEGLARGKIALIERLKASDAKTNS